MSALPEGWESDYDGTRWFYTYKPTGHIQYHFPNEGDEFPDFVDALAPVPILAPEERLESRRQTTATGVDKAAASNNETKTRMSASAQPIDEIWDDADIEEEGNDGRAFQPESFMYLGPGAYTDISPLVEEEDEAAKRAVVGTADEVIESKRVSPVTSEKTTPKVAQVEPTETSAQQESPKTEAPAIQSTEETKSLPTTSEPTDVPTEAQQQTTPTETTTTNEEQSAMIDGREIPHELPVTEPRFDPVGLVAEMATEHTAAAYIEIHPDPVEMGDNLVLAPIETAAPLGIAELPEKTSPVEEKPREQVGSETKEQDKPKENTDGAVKVVSEEKPEKTSSSSSDGPSPSEVPAQSERALSNGPDMSSDSQPATTTDAVETTPLPSPSSKMQRKPIASPTSEVDLHTKPGDSSDQQTLSHVPSILKPVRHALSKNSEPQPAQTASTETASDVEQQGLAKHPSVLLPARGRAMSQAAETTTAVGQEPHAQPMADVPIQQQQPMQHQVSRPDMHRAVTEPVQKVENGANGPAVQYANLPGQQPRAFTAPMQGQPLLRSATVMPPGDYKPQLLPVQQYPTIQPYPVQHAAQNRQQAGPNNLGGGPLPSSQGPPNPPYPLSDLAPQFAQNPGEIRDRRGDGQRPQDPRNQVHPPYTPHYQAQPHRRSVSQGQPQHSYGNVGGASPSPPSSVSQSPGVPPHTPSPMSQTPGLSPQPLNMKASPRKPIGPSSASEQLPANAATNTSAQPGQPTHDVHTPGQPPATGTLPSPPVPGKIPLDPSQQQYCPPQNGQVPTVTLSSPSVRRTPVGQLRKLNKRHSMPAQQSTSMGPQFSQGPSNPGQFQGDPSAGAKSQELPSSQMSQGPVNSGSHGQPANVQGQPPTSQAPGQPPTDHNLGRIEEREETGIPREMSPLSTHSGLHTRRHSAVSSIHPPPSAQNENPSYPSTQHHEVPHGSAIPWETTPGQQTNWQAQQTHTQAPVAQHFGAQPQGNWPQPYNGAAPNGQVLQHNQGLPQSHAPQQHAPQQVPIALQNQALPPGQQQSPEWMTSQGLAPQNQLRSQQKQSSWSNYMSSSKIPGLKPTKASAQAAMSSIKPGLTSAQAAISKNLKPGVASAQNYMENLKPGMASAQAAVNRNLKPGMTSAQTAFSSFAGKSKDKLTKLRKSSKAGPDISAPLPLATPGVGANGMAPSPDLRGQEQMSWGGGGYHAPTVSQQPVLLPSQQPLQYPTSFQQPGYQQQSSYQQQPSFQQQVNAQQQPGFPQQPSFQQQPGFQPQPGFHQTTQPQPQQYQQHQQQQHQYHPYQPHQQQPGLPQSQTPQPQHPILPQQQYPQQHPVNTPSPAAAPVPEQPHQATTPQGSAQSGAGKIRRKQAPGPGSQGPQPSSSTPPGQQGSSHQGPLNSHPLGAAVNNAESPMPNQGKPYEPQMQTYQGQPGVHYPQPAVAPLSYSGPQTHTNPVQ